MAWIGPAIGAAGSLLGGALSGSSNAASMANYDATQLQLQANQESYNTQMADTEYSRAVQSMKDAGLNPALAYQQGGISVPAAPNANIQPIPGMGSSLGPAISNAAQFASTAVDQKLKSAQADQVSASADKTRADTATTLAQLPFAGSTANQNLINMGRTAANLSAELEEIHSRFNLNQQNIDRISQDMDFQRQMQPILQDLNTVNFQRLQLGMPKLQNDAAWQKLHPVMSGWLQSGAYDAGLSTANAVMRGASLFK